MSVKHLNPRQGITMLFSGYCPESSTAIGVKHLNPRQGITITFSTASKYASSTFSACETPKSPPGDYNGVFGSQSSRARLAFGVKHLNPRQGITISTLPAKPALARSGRCETPKSPPGDYNTWKAPNTSMSAAEMCETPKSPPGDYNPRTALASWDARRQSV